MPFSPFDISFCMNRTCPQWGANPCCGRSAHNFEGKRVLLWFSEYKPDDTGKCKDYMEPRIWNVEPWMEEQAKRADREAAEE